MLGLLVPSVIASWYAEDGEQIRDRLNAGNAVNNAELVSGIRALERSLSVQSNPSAWFSLGLLQATGINRVDLGTAQALLLRRALDSHKAGLAAAAIDSAAWFRLARLRVMALGPTRRAGQAFAMSLRTAPSDRSLAFSRTAFGLQIQGTLAREGRDLLFHQIETAWALEPERTVSLAVSINELATLATALSRDRMARRRFLEMVRGLDP